MLSNSSHCLPPIQFPISAIVGQSGAIFLPW
jgi:hypothetical protein